jgi:predicted acyltransferase
VIEEADLVDVRHDADAESHRAASVGEMVRGLSAGRSTLVNVESGRLLSLDALRGFTIAAMIVVNNPGTWVAVHPPLRHAAWHGLTPTDVVFPCFLFILGVAIPASLAGRSAPGALLRVARRAVLIFALGLVLNAFPAFDWSTVRIPGVLQRIAVCYLLAALLYLVTGWRTQLAVVVSLLLGYWAVLTLVPVPGFGAGTLTPEGNVAGWVDRAVLGPHVWRASRVYDPEGVLSTAPALATVLMGVLAGRWVRTHRAPRTIVTGLVLLGVVALALGAEWGNWLPLNKALWTSSYAVFTGGIALLLFAGFYWTIESWGCRRWATPFVVLGVNALAVYFLSSLAAIQLTVARVGERSLQQVLFERGFAWWATPVNASLAYAVVYLLVWWAAMWGPYRAGVRLRA